MSEPQQIGFRVYRGANSPLAIDYAAPIATAEPGATQVSLAGVDWPAGVDWFVAVRALDADGVEYADPLSVVRLRIDADGNVLPPRPAPVGSLSAWPTAERKIAARWRSAAGDDRPPAARYEVFLGPTLGQTLEQLLAAAPADTVLASGDLLEWTSPPLTAGRRYRVAVRAVSESGSAGPAVEATAWALASQAAAIPLLLGEVR